ncbi:MAG: hypothetical protein ACREIQ_05940, partial [Nitrospiria bacterium]
MDNPNEIIREVPPDKAPNLTEWRKARLLKFAKEFRRNGGDKEKALEDSGDEWGEPLKIKRKWYRKALAENLYRKAVAQNLLRPEKAYLEDVETIPKEQLLSLLTQQARGEKASYRQEVLR